MLLILPLAAFALLACALLGLGGSIHDYLLSQGLFFDPEEPFLLYFAADALLLVVGLQLADRFVKSLGAAEQASATLAIKVAEKERELAANYEKLRGHERERAVAAERQRIMQDMHDGLGSQLLTSLAAVERGALDPKGMAQVLRDAMDDMRLAIDTLSPGPEGLLEALGNLRYRLEPRASASPPALSSRSTQRLSMWKNSPVTRPFDTGLARLGFETGRVRRLDSHVGLGRSRQ